MTVAPFFLEKLPGMTATQELLCAESQFQTELKLPLLVENKTVVIQNLPRSRSIPAPGPGGLLAARAASLNTPHSADFAPLQVH